MKKFIDTIKSIWGIEELKTKILVTLGLLLVYRFGAQVSLPGMDYTKLGDAFTGNFDDGLGGLLNMFTGGAFAKASVFALGIMPYISASIVVQLMGIAIPYLQKLQKEGESGRKKNHTNHKMAYHPYLFGASTILFMGIRSLRCSRRSIHSWKRIRFHHSICNHFDHRNHLCNVAW
jgi:preprotein translocase subunit SecY